MLINSFSYAGDKTKANINLKEPLRHRADGRMVRSSSHLISVSKYKKSIRKSNKWIRFTIESQSIHKPVLFSNTSDAFKVTGFI